MDRTRHIQGTSWVKRVNQGEKQVAGPALLGTPSRSAPTLPQLKRGAPWVTKKWILKKEEVKKRHTEGQVKKGHPLCGGSAYKEKRSPKLLV